MPQTKQRRAHSSPNAVHKAKPNISRPRRTSTAKQSRFTRGWTFRSKPQPTGIKRIFGGLTASKAGSKKGQAAAAGGLALIAGGLAAMRKRQSDRDAPAPEPVTNTTVHTQTPADTDQPVAQDHPQTS
jgi:hypothetical protein